MKLCKVAHGYRSGWIEQIDVVGNGPCFPGMQNLVQNIRPFNQDLIRKQMLFGINEKHFRRRIKNYKRNKS